MKHWIKPTPKAPLIRGRGTWRLPGLDAAGDPGGGGPAGRGRPVVRGHDGVHRQLRPRPGVQTRPVRKAHPPAGLENLKIKVPLMPPPPVAVGLNQVVKRPSKIWAGAKSPR